MWMLFLYFTTFSENQRLTVMNDQKINEEKIQAKLKEYYAKLQELEGKAKELRAEMELKIDAEIEELKEKNTKLYDTFQDLKSSSSSAFVDIREGFDKATSALHEAIRKASHHFKG